MIWWKILFWLKAKPKILFAVRKTKNEAFLKKGIYKKSNLYQIHSFSPTWLPMYNLWLHFAMEKFSNILQEETSLYSSALKLSTMFCINKNSKG